MAALSISILLAGLSAADLAAQGGRTYTIAVLDLDPIGVSQVEARGLSEKLNSHIAGIVQDPSMTTDRYELIERSQIDRIFEQFEIQNFACSSDSCAVEFGKMLQADRIVIGSVSLLGETYSVTARIVDVESGRTIRSADRQHRGSIDDVLVGIIPAVGTELLTGRRIAVPSDVPAPAATGGEPAPETHFGITMLPVPVGSFSMGSENGGRDERPVHTVSLDGFYMSETEITQGQYRTVTGRNPASFDDDDSLPVEDLNWEDAARFCNTLSVMAGFEECYNERTWVCDFTKNGFRLPTEAEWEYACRAGSATAFFCGDTPGDLLDAGWCSENSDSRTHPVAEKEPNGWGLYDMHGNVREWVQGWYGRYEESGARNPSGPASGTYRVYRGGGFSDSADDCRSARRVFARAGERDRSIGFRIVRRSGGGR